jgi:hypothetical protein
MDSRPPQASALLKATATAVLRAAALAGLLAQGGCTSTTEIVLTIDTDLAVTEMDQVQISIVGPSQQASGPYSVNLSAPDAPALPLTLGLTPGGAPSSVSIQVVGFLGSAMVVTREVQTEFVANTLSRVSILLTLSCVGMTCPSGQTCDQGTCVSIEQSGVALPAWTGVPPRLNTDAVPIAGRSVWSSGWHSCATKGSSFSCWGQNANGELGAGPAVDPFVSTRRAVVGLPSLSSVGLGEYHSCVCDETGQAWCWGSNTYGQIGAGGTGAKQTTPTQVLLQATPTPVPLDDCVQITSGGYHTCALRRGGIVSCWGRNNAGQCGQSASSQMLTMPSKVPGLAAVVEVRAGESYTCARQANGYVLCWGDNTLGQLGDGTLTSREAPKRVSGVSNPAEVIAGRFFACVRYGTGTVSCWGETPDVLVGMAAGPDKLPVDVAGITDAIQVGIGHAHACVLQATGAVSCWGSNEYEQLGDPNALDTATPIPVASIPSDVTSIAVGDVHSCARRATGTILCWGQDAVNQLGDNNGGGQATNGPVSVIGF